NAVYNGITSYADQLRRQDKQKQQAQQNNNNANSNSQDIEEMKSMMSDMVYLMQAMLQSSNNIEKSNNDIANNPVYLDGKEISNNTRKDMGNAMNMMNYNLGRS